MDVKSVKIIRIPIFVAISKNTCTRRQIKSTFDISSLRRKKLYKQ